MTIKTREPDERFKAQIPDFKLEKRARPKYRTWRDDPDEAPKAEPIAKDQQTTSKPTAEVEAKVSAAESDLQQSAPIASQETPANVQPSPGKPIAESIANAQQNYSKPPAEASAAAKEHPAQPIATGKQKPSKTIAKAQQTHSKFTPSSLTGIQKRLIELYYENSQSRGSHETLPMTLEYLTAVTGTDGKTLKDANLRLIKKGLLLRVSFKAGRGGWVVYRLPDAVREELYRSVTHSKTLANHQHMYSKPTVQPIAQPTAEASSSSILFTTPSDPEGNSLTHPTVTTTGISIDYGWIETIDVPAELGQWVTVSHLRQLARHGFTATEADIVQSSLDNLAYAIGLGKKYQSVPGVFMAAMKRDGYFSPVESPEFNRERARRAMEADKVKVEEAVQQEIMRLAYEKLDETGQKSESLDITPF